MNNGAMCERTNEIPLEDEFEYVLKRHFWEGRLLWRVASDTVQAAVFCSHRASCPRACTVIKGRPPSLLSAFIAYGVPARSSFQLKNVFKFKSSSGIS